MSVYNAKAKDKISLTYFCTSKTPSENKNDSEINLLLIEENILTQALKIDFDVCNT